MPSNVVLTMHPKTKDAWRDIVPDAGDPFYVETPDGPWHRDHDCPEIWSAVYTSLCQQARAALEHPNEPLHAFVLAPLSFGFLLGRKVEAFGSLSVYQFDQSAPGGAGWVSWGPAGEPATDPSSSYFQPVEDLPRSPRPGVRDVVLVVEITHRICRAVECDLPGLGIEQAPMLTLRAPEPGPVALSPRQVGQAEREFWSTLSAIRGAYPNARMHLFYSGPLALAIRAGRKIHIGDRETIAYERIGGTYLPRVRFPEGSPMWGSPEGPPMTLRALSGAGGLTRAGGERFEIQVDSRRTELSLPAPDPLVTDKLPWLLNERLNSDPGNQENAALSDRIEKTLLAWAEAAGRALSDALGGVTPGPLTLEFGDIDSAVFRWPWEWMKLPSGQAIGATVPLWRRLSIPPPPAPGPILGGPIRVLLCISRGADQRAGDDVAYRNIAAPLLDLASLYPNRLEVEILPRPCTLKAIHARLRDVTRPVHVLHVDGHGIAGQLCLEDDQFRSLSVSATELADAVAGIGLRAVVLNACHSAEAAGGQALEDLAVELHRRGVPAVLAMQAALRVDAAQILARVLYEGLAQTGRIDRATMRARDTLFHDQQRDSKGRSYRHPDWGVPVLYRHPDGNVIASFDPAPIPNTLSTRRRRVAMDWMVLQLDQIVLHAPGGAVLVHGPLGSGKSALLEDAVQWWLDARWLAALPMRLDGAVKTDDPTPGASAVARLREAREALGPRSGRQLRILVWDSFDEARPWTWSPADRVAFTAEIEAFAAQGGLLLLAGRDRLRRLGGLTRLPMDGLAMREARQHGRALARSRPGAQRGDGDGTFDVLEQICEYSAHNPACLNVMFQAALQESWTPRPLMDLRYEQLPDALHEPFDALSSSLEVVLAEIDDATLASLPGRLNRSGLELRVLPEETPMGGPLDLLERAGAIGLSPLRDRSGAHRYRVHPLLMICLERLAASRERARDR